ncbi:MAG: barstar family protein [Clostridia bacterium]|nr:barstar family protein [Clostridia bacterium]MBO7404582.1 barstar family protein [Clostridia bacterium]
MRYVILNGSAITDRKTLYDALEAHLDLPDYFGRNLDALDDVLYDLLLAQPMTIEIEETETLLRSLGRYGETFLRVLDRLAKENGRLTLAFR